MFVGELTFPITQIKGVGKVTAADFASLGVEKACDLVTLFPRSYDDRTVMRSLKDIGDEGGTINTAVAITDHSHYMSKGQRVLKMTARDLNSGRTLHLHCFGRSFMENAYPVGTSWFINATVTKTGSVFSASAFQRLGLYAGRKRGGRGHRDDPACLPAVGLAHPEDGAQGRRHDPVEQVHEIRRRDPRASQARP